MNNLSGWGDWQTKLPKLEKVSDLIYFGGPFLSHFRSESGDSYLYHFCESEDGISRWLVFRVHDEVLNSYVERRRDLRSLITSAADGFVFMLDLNEYADIVKIRYAKPESVPVSYLPPSGMLYDGIPIAAVIDTMALSEKFGTSVLNLHLASQGREHQFGYGTARLSKLADVLYSLDKIVKDSAEHTYTRAARVDANHRAIHDRIFNREEYSYDVAAFAPTGSVNLVLKPAFIGGELLPDVETSQGQITEGVLSMFNELAKVEQIDENLMERFGEDVIQSASQFIADLGKAEIGFSLSYADATKTSKPHSSTDIPARLAVQITANLRKGTSDNSKLYLDGMFTHLNVRTRYYEFVSKTGTISTGHLRPSLKSMLKGIKLLSPYRASIDRRIIQSDSHIIERTQDAISNLEPLRQRLQIDVNEIIGLPPEIDEE